MKGTKHLYQIVLVLGPKVDGEAAEKIFTKLESLLFGGKVSKKDNWGLKELVYDIQGFRKANFWVLDIESEKPMKINEINLFLNREVQVIRYLILKN